MLGGRVSGVGVVEMLILIGVLGIEMRILEDMWIFKVGVLGILESGMEKVIKEE